MTRLLRRIHKGGLPALLLCSLAAHAQESQPRMKMNIRIHQGPVISATLDENPTTRDFIRLLPLTLTLMDYNRTEKISDLPQKLTQEQAPSALMPKAGDMAYYAPWGNLALFYRDFGRSPGLIRLGQLPIEALEAFSGKAPLTVTLEVSP